MKQQFLIIDDHELLLRGTLDILTNKYPAVEIVTASTVQQVYQQLKKAIPSLVIIDLSIPQADAMTAQIDSGIQLLRSLMKKYPAMNIVVQSSYSKTLVRIKPEIDSHQGGFTIADKNLASEEMLKRVDWALQGLSHTKELRNRFLELKPTWLTVLDLAFHKGLQDRAIAQSMNVSEPTVRHYWAKLQDILDIYPEDGKNLRIQIQIRAREAGLID
ncbi:MAG: response regulator transcription factor [Chamaesiphon sp.]